MPVDKFLTQMVNKAPLKTDFSFMSVFARHTKPTRMQEFRVPELWVRNLRVENAIFTQMWAGLFYKHVPLLWRR